MEQHETSISEDSDDISEEDFYVQSELFRSKDEQNSSSLVNSLEKVGRYMFAEDLVSYIALEFHGITYTYKINNDSELLCNPFNEAVRRAVHFIRWQINEVNCPSFEIVKELSNSCKLYYESFVEAILSRYSEKGLKAGMFLCYCVYFAELACKCYRTDFTEVLDNAVYAILDAFCMLNEGRYELNNVVKCILCMAENRSFYPDYKPLWRAQSDITCMQSETHEEPSIRMHFSSQGNQVEEALATLEQFKLEGELKKSEVTCNSDVTMIEDTESESKSLKFDIKGADNKLSLNSGDSIVSITDEKCYIESENLPNSPEVVDFMQEVMSAVSFEASLFSAIYLLRETKMELDSPDESNTKNETGNEEIIKCLNSSNNEIRNSDFEPDQLKSHSFVHGEGKTVAQFVTPYSVSTQQEVESMSQDFLNGVLESEDVLFRNTESKALEFAQDRLLSQSLAGNKAENLNAQPVDNCTRLEWGETTENSVIVDPNSVVKVDDKDEHIEMLLAVYKPEGEASAENLIVLKGDAFIFAEDLVRYISKEFYGIPYSESKFEEHRALLYNAFNETVKEAIRVIRGEVEIVNRIVFDIISNVKENRLDCYRKYVAAILSHYTQDGINSDVFLYYCLHFSELASRCCTFDLKDMLDFAVYSILDALCLLKDDWNECNVTAEKIARFSKECAINKDCSYQHGQIAVCPTKDVDDFGNECLQIILGSLKDIQQLCSKLEGNEFKTLKTKVEEMLTVFETTYSTQLSNAIELNNNINVNISEQSENEAITDGKEEIPEKVKNSGKDFSSSEMKYFQNLGLEVCSIISLEAAKLSKEVLSGI